MLRLLKTLFGMPLLCGYVVANAVTPQVAAGFEHSIGLSADGKVYGWGSDADGQLGQGQSLLATAPQTVPGLNLGQVSERPRVAAAGFEHSVVVKSDGSVWAWGKNSIGQLGDGTWTDRSSPVQVPGLAGVVAVAAGGYHSLALKSDGSVWAWGENRDGQLGGGTTTSSNSPIQVPGLTGVVAVAAGYGYTVAVKSDGSAWAWGANSFGQLGDGTTTTRNSPVQVQGLTGVVAVAAGYSYTVAVKSDGSAWAWGANSFGQLGDGTTMDRTSPVQVPGLTGVVAVAAGTGHTLALKSDGSVWAWGYNLNGQLGDGTTTNYRTTPAQVSGLTNAVAVTAGAGHTLALKSDGSAWAWGSNQYCQLGDGTTTDRVSPVQVPGFAGVTAVVGGNWHTLAVKSDGSVWAWGDSTSGKLGDGITTTHTSPVQVPGFTGAAAVAAGAFHTMAAKSDGSVWAWGGNISGQLGDGTTTSHSSPVQVLGLSNAVAVVAGGVHSLALKSDGSVWAWGQNDYGQLGDDAATNRSSPAQVPGLTGVVAVASGWGHNLAAQSDGSVWTWGQNDYGQLGDSTTVSRSLPIQVTGLTGVVAVAAEWSHSLAVKSDGSVWAWGKNDYGQLGDGTTVNRTSPVQVQGLTGVVAVGVGGFHTAALKSDGSVWAWGANWYGQLGDGTWTNRSTPMQVSGLTGIVAVAAGNGRTIVMNSDGSIRVWGDNSVGQLGDGTLAERHSPVLTVNPGVDGFLNLLTGTTVDVPPELQVPFFVSASGGIADTNATVNTTTKFNAADVGKSGEVYVTAWAPANGLGKLGISTARLNQAMSITVTHDNPYLGGKARSRQEALGAILATSDSNTFVLVQLTSSGWQLVSNGQLIPYASGVLGDQLATQTILSATDTTNLKGAEFCLGYGTSAEEMTSAGRMRAVATIPSDPGAASTATGSCIIQGSSVDTTANVIEFYNTSLDHYFITANANEAAVIDNGGAGPGWSRTGNSFKSGGSASVCRFYGSQSPGPNSHFYTVDSAECQGLKDQQIPTEDPRKLTSKSWNYESLDFVSTVPANGTCPTDTTPVYRAYNNGYARGVDSNHRITSSLSAINEVVARGWNNEGVVMCAPN